MNGDGEAVNLQLRHVLEVATVRELSTALVEGAQVFYVVAVIQREHGAAMNVLVEALRRPPAHALRGAVRRD
jgi:hypothetical protein